MKIDKWKYFTIEGKVRALAESKGLDMFKMVEDTEFPKPVHPDTIRESVIKYVDNLYPTIKILDCVYIISEYIEADHAGFGDLYVSFIEEQVRTGVYTRLFNCEDSDDIWLTKDLIKYLRNNW